MITVGIGDVAYTDDPSESIITHALGSCVAVVMHCTVTRRTAMAHVVLPHELLGKNDREAYYADVTVKRMLNYFLADCRCKKSYLNVHLIGGADSLNEHDRFQIGRRNVASAADVLRRNYIRYSASETGGHYSRTVIISVKHGRIKVRKRSMLL